MAGFGEPEWKGTKLEFRTGPLSIPFHSIGHSESQGQTKFRDGPDAQSCYSGIDTGRGIV